MCCFYRPNWIYQVLNIRDTISFSSFWIFFFYFFFILNLYNFFYTIYIIYTIIIVLPMMIFTLVRVSESLWPTNLTNFWSPIIGRTIFCWILFFNCFIACIVIYFGTVIFWFICSIIPIYYESHFKSNSSPLMER